MTSADFAERIVSMQETLYRVCYGLLSQPCDREDAVQECIRIAWQKRGALREERFLQTWVIRILIHECRNIQRKRRKEPPVSEIPERAGPPPDADPDLHDALIALDETLRLAVVLHYLEGYPVAEVAKMMRLPAGTVKSRLSRARTLLRDKLREEEAVRA